MSMIFAPDFLAKLDIEREWMEDAACVDMPSDLFFPGAGDSDTTASAREICARCPVTADCLDYALIHHEEHGIWGGSTSRQRRLIRRARNVA